MPLRLDALAPDELDARTQAALTRSRTKEKRPSKAPMPMRTSKLKSEDERIACASLILSGVLDADRAGGAYGVSGTTARRWTTDLEAAGKLDRGKAVDVVLARIRCPVVNPSSPVDTRNGGADVASGPR